MRRGLWFAAGAGLGVYAMVRGRRAAEAFTADGLHDRWQALGVGARLFRDEVATGKAEAETRLRERFGPTYDPTPQLGAGSDGPPGLDTPTLVPREGYATNDDNRHDFEEGSQ
ncbi:hypothetical protein GCM10009798_19010 [Nocardioides panacihumi]|uniref:YtxH domain-containing protein n=1 Tax=Nocardioides panacihumi TaxID=400774 RepID=A0ABP5CBD5_9ACTN